METETRYSELNSVLNIWLYVSYIISVGVVLYKRKHNSATTKVGIILKNETWSIFCRPTRNVRTLIDCKIPSFYGNFVYSSSGKKFAFRSYLDYSVIQSTITFWPV